MSQNDTVSNQSCLAQFSMSVTAVPFDKTTGEMRWKAVASDTNKDLFQEAMSEELYRSFLENVKKTAPPPEPFKSFVVSDFWQGGMPYLSISHFPDLNGDGVPGNVSDLYIDGKCLKSKGRFFDTSLGRACWKSLNKDFAEKVPEDKRIRISIAFLDLAHRHGTGPIFERKSLGDICPECLKKVGNKIYLKGYLVHLAMTRVPVNPRAEMEVEKSMSKLTREEDAASIVGSDEAEKLNEKAALVGRADILVTKSDDEVVAEEVVAEVPVVEPDPVVPAVETPVEPVVEPAAVLEETSNPNPPEQDGTPIDAELKTLSEAIMKVKDAPVGKEAKLQAIRPAIDGLGAAIDKALTDAGVEVPATAPTMTPEMVKAIVAEQTQPVMSILENIQAQLANVNTIKSVVQNTIPKPRSPDPMIVRAAVQRANGEAKPSSVLDICRKSVGINN